jgi:hypothetical protein
MKDSYGTHGNRQKIKTKHFKNAGQEFHDYGM